MHCGTNGPLPLPILGWLFGRIRRLCIFKTIAVFGRTEVHRTRHLQTATTKRIGEKVARIPFSSVVPILSELGLSVNFLKFFICSTLIRMGSPLGSPNLSARHKCD